MPHDAQQCQHVRSYTPPPDRESITTGDRRRLRVECVGNVDVVFHEYTDERLTLVDVSYLPSLNFNLYLLHEVQRTHLVISDASGAHNTGTNVTFPCSSSGSYLSATRLPAGNERAERRTTDCVGRCFRL